MSIATYHKVSTACANVKASLLVLLLVTMPAIGTAEIIWSGDFETGNFTQWHISSDPSEVNFHQIPAYGRPIQYGGQHPLHVGDGSLLSLVQNPTRGGLYAAKFTVKNSANGSEPAECDNGVCTRRRTVLTVQQTLPKHYDAMPYMSERWISISVYLPSDWEEQRSGWGPLMLSVKPLIEKGSAGLSAIFSIEVEGTSWRIDHRWSPIENPTMDQIPWQQSMLYTNDFIAEGGGPYPRSDFWPQGLVDYPDVAASQAALGTLNKGGWTDWVVHTKFDAKGSDANGTGFLTVWKRDGSGPWIKVLHIVPKQTTRGGMTFDHGIGYNSPAGSTHPGGFGIKVGMYMKKTQVWNNARNRVIYLDNIKVGDASTTIEDMFPDGSSPGSPAPQTKPMPPTLIVN